MSGGDHDGSVLVVGDVPLDKSGGLSEGFAVGLGVGGEGVEIEVGGDVDGFGEFGEVGF